MTSKPEWGECISHDLPSQFPIDSATGKRAAYWRLSPNVTDGDGKLLVHKGDVFMPWCGPECDVAKAPCDALLVTEKLGAGAFGTVFKAAVLPFSVLRAGASAPPPVLPAATAAGGSGSGGDASGAGGSGLASPVFVSAPPKHELTYLALKVVRNVPLYLAQAEAEVRAFQQLAASEASRARDDTCGCSITGRYPIVRLLKHFTRSGHPCLVFEHMRYTALDMLQVSIIMIRRQRSLTPHCRGLPCQHALSLLLPLAFLPPSLPSLLACRCAGSRACQ